jgi:hypothetical protein
MQKKDATRVIRKVEKEKPLERWRFLERVGEVSSVTCGISIRLVRVGDCVMCFHLHYARVTNGQMEVTHVARIEDGEQLPTRSREGCEDFLKSADSNMCINSYHISACGTAYKKKATCIGECPSAFSRRRSSGADSTNS